MTRPAPTRTTLRAPATLSGLGLFSAKPCELTIHPADAGTGIVLVNRGRQIRAHIDHLSMRPVHSAFAQLKPRCTCLGDERASVSTVEHLMSALTGLGITDARIEINTSTPDDPKDSDTGDNEPSHAEVPILDGSAVAFVDAITAAGLVPLDAPIEPIRVRQTIVVRDGDASITVEPAASPSYHYTLDYPGSVPPTATVRWDGDREDYTRSIAPARTFCLAHEAAAMRDLGLFSHLTTRDMLVIGEDGPIDNRYRLDDECARHKLLDLIGDMALAGPALVAKVTGVRSGHALAHEAARAIVAQSR